ncbi:TetR/AcrR family transcriptional regulator [Streptomyces xiamenensis]
MSEVSRRGRPRSPATEQAILTATRELLIENGYARLSMERVAARTGVGKPTLYRRWSSKGELVAATVAHDLLSAVPPDTGDVEHDLRDWLRAQARSVSAPRNAPLVLALIAAAAESPQDAETLYGRITGPQRAVLLRRLRGGVAEGTLRGGADWEAVADALTGSLMYQLLTGAADAAERRALALFDALLTGLLPRGDGESGGEDESVGDGEDDGRRDAPRVTS